MTCINLPTKYHKLWLPYSLITQFSSLIYAIIFNFNKSDTHFTRNDVRFYGSLLLAIVRMSDFLFCIVSEFCDRVKLTPIARHVPRFPVWKRIAYLSYDYGYIDTCGRNLIRSVSKCGGYWEEKSQPYWAGWLRDWV